MAQQIEGMLETGYAQHDSLKLAMVDGLQRGTIEMRLAKSDIADLPNRSGESR